jgi:hypothetical protein
MRLTFTLQSAYTGATYVAGPFNVSGTTSAGTTYELATGVTKTQLTAGYAIDTIYETLTGGTIASTGTCTTTRSWQISEPEPTTVTLNVRGRDLDATPETVNLFYSINGGTAEYFAPAAFGETCGLYGTIGGLQDGDVIDFGTDELHSIPGADSFDCPEFSGSNVTYSHTVTATGGFDYVSFTLNTGILG